MIKNYIKQFRSRVSSFFNNEEKRKRKEQVYDILSGFQRNVPIEDVLTEEQIKKVENYYQNNKNIVDNMMKETKLAYPPDHPTQFEDRNNPSIWKPEYWRWYFRNKK